ncbi:hypothetical protein [Hymenobacter chitinivorans]|nr:hypothetical protein [Hymenobacter chitinivorans]
MSNLELEGENCPAWDFITDEDWQSVLNNFVFKIADSFAFAGVFKKADLFPDGLSYFGDWVLEAGGLVEADDDIVCMFQLNESCKAKLLQYEFAVHNFKSEKFSDYYEFDQLYFFSGERLIANYINHEGMIVFLDLNDNEAILIESLDPHLKAAFVDSSAFAAAFNANRYS